MIILDSTGLSSSWIAAAYLMREDANDESSPKSLALEFRDGVVCWYKYNTSEVEYYEIIGSGSPGRYLSESNFLHDYQRINL